jgi:hypothetical protein
MGSRALGRVAGIFKSLTRFFFSSKIIKRGGNQSSKNQI